MEISLDYYDPILAKARSIFEKKNQDYGTSWRIMRPISIMDQLFIKAKRISTITKNGSQKVNGQGDDISSEFMGIINYGVMGIIQLRLESTVEDDLPKEEALMLYKEILEMVKKNSQKDFKERNSVLESLSIATTSNLILATIISLKNILSINNDFSQKCTEKLLEMINYAVIGILILKRNEI